MKLDKVGVEFKGKTFYLFRYRIELGKRMMNVTDTKKCVGIALFHPFTNHWSLKQYALIFDLVLGRIKF